MDKKTLVILVLILCATWVVLKMNFTSSYTESPGIPI